MSKNWPVSKLPYQTSIQKYR